MSHQLYQDLKVGSYVCIYSVPLEPFCNLHEAYKDLIEIRLKVDISQLHIPASITSKRTMTIRYIYDLPIRKSSTYLWDLNFKNCYQEKYFWTDFSGKEALFSLDHGNSFQMRQIK